MAREAVQRDASAIPAKRGRRQRAEIAPVAEPAEDINAAKINTQDTYARIMSGRVDQVDKDMGMVTLLGKQPVMSTRVLMFDLAQGAGGLMPGLHIVFGGEGSAKSTMEMTIMGASLSHSMAMRGYYDAEGALDRKYTSQVIRTDDFESIFGARDQNGKWYKQALVRYYDSNITEEVFGSIHRQLKLLPNKVYQERLGCWMLTFDRTRPQVALMKDLLAAGVISTPHKKLFTSTGMYWCETDNGSPQAIFFPDSLPQLIPGRIEEGQSSDNASGWQAAALGKGMRYVRGLCRPKCAIIQAVNQLRSNVRPGPGQPDFYEPAGNAIKFNSDSRWLFTSRVPMGMWKEVRTGDVDGGKGVCTERSVEFPGGFDTYMFKGITCYKNKYGAQQRKSSVRIWTRDGAGVARGIDPVYDTIAFLDRLDLLRGFQPATITDPRRKFRIDLPRIADVDWTYPMVKALIIGQDFGNRRLVKQAVDMGAPRFRLRDCCFDLIARGKAEEMLIRADTRVREKNAAGMDLEADMEGDD